jgi:hypothetical protein
VPLTQTEVAFYKRHNDKPFFCHKPSCRKLAVAKGFDFKFDSQPGLPQEPSFQRARREDPSKQSPRELESAEAKEGRGGIRNRRPTLKKSQLDEDKSVAQEKCRSWKYQASNGSRSRRTERSGALRNSNETSQVLESEEFLPPSA